MSEGSVAHEEDSERRARIMVVEDEAVVAMDLEAQLQDMGYEFCGRVDNGVDAIALAASRQPDLVLMDIVIKGAMDGVETADHISRIEHIPIVFLTAYSDEATVQRAARTAPYSYLNKPFQSRELRAAIEIALHKAKLERRLRESEQWLASTLRGVADGVLATDALGRVRFMNPAAENLLGRRSDEVSGREVADVVRFADGDSDAVLPSPALQALRENVVVGGASGILLTARGGERLPVEHSAAPIRDEHGKVLGVVVVLHDVRERLAAEQRLRQSEARFRDTFNLAPVGMALVDLDNRFVEVNSALCQLLGFAAADLIGADQSSFSHAEERQLEREHLDDLLSGRASATQFEKRFRCADDSDVWALVSVSLLQECGDEHLCFLFQVQNVTKRKEAEFRLARLAHFDPLTGLANRAWLTETLIQAIAMARRHRHRLAVIFLDLDYFKQINDTLGHEAGDQMLQAIAGRLQASVRDTDCVARLGGDEFVILLPEVDDIEGVLVLTDKVQIECSKPVRISGNDVRVSLSLGVSLFPDDAQEPHTLLRYADSALYHAKAEGRNHLQFYRPELTARMELRMRLVAGLRVALERHEFELYYQPIVSLLDQKPLGAEALIRWNHPEMGMLRPDSFIELAEEVGLSVSIGEWVIGEACRQATQWPGSDGTSLGISVNVSAAQFKAGNLLHVVERELAAAGLDAKRLCIEITEQFLVTDNDLNRTTINALKALGVRIAIDDFGTGYSSLSSISHFRPTELKIDRSLIGGVGVRSEQTAIVIAALAVAHSLQLKVVTEGVETQAQQIFLREHGCDMAQGFFYVEPRPAHDFQAWLSANQH